jgi:hypothetical protein
MNTHTHTYIDMHKYIHIYIYIYIYIYTHTHIVLAWRSLQSSVAYGSLTRPYLHSFIAKSHEVALILVHVYLCCLLFTNSCCIIDRERDMQSKLLGITNDSDSDGNNKKSNFIIRVTASTNPNTVYCSSCPYVCVYVCIYVCVCVYLNIYIPYTYIHIYICTYINAQYMHMCVYALMTIKWPQDQTCPCAPNPD